MGGTQGQAARCSRKDRPDDLRVGMAKNRWPPRPDVVDIAPTIGIPDVRSLAAFENQRRSADGLEGAHWAVDTPREQALSVLDDRGHPRTHRRAPHQPAPSKVRISSIGR